MTIRIQVRRDTYQNWYDRNPLLAEGEITFDNTNNQFKIGIYDINENPQNWRDLPYTTVSPAQLADILSTLTNNFETTYIPLTSIDVPNGIPSLNNEGYVPDTEISLNIARSSDLSEHVNAHSGVHGVVGNVVGTTDTQDLSNKRIIDTLYFTDGVTIANEGQIFVNSSNNNFEITANYGNLNLNSNNSDIVLSADGNIIANSPIYVDTIYSKNSGTDNLTIQANQIILQNHDGVVVGGSGSNGIFYVTDTTNTDIFVVDGDITLKGTGQYLGSISSENQIATVSDVSTAQSTAETYTDTAVANLVNSAPATLNTLKELADAINDDANFATTITNSLATKITASSTDVLTNKTISISSGIISAAGYDNIDGFKGQSNIPVLQDGIDKGGKISVDSNGVITVDVNGSTYSAGIAVIGGGTRIIIVTPNNTLTGKLEDFNAALIGNDFATQADVSSLNTSISNAINTSEQYTRDQIDFTVNDLNRDIQTAKSQAITTSEQYTDAAITSEVLSRNNAISTAKSEAISTSEGYTDSAITAEVTNRNNAIATAKSEAETYTDNAVGTEVNSRNYAIGQALSTSEGYTDAAISNISPDGEHGIKIGSGGKLEIDLATYGGLYIEPNTHKLSIDGYYWLDKQGTLNAISQALSTAEVYTDSAILTEQTNRDNAIFSAKTESISISETYTDDKISTEVTNRNNAIATAKSQAIGTAEGYTDSAISTEVTNRNSAISTAKSEAISTSEDYTDTAVANLVNSAPAALNTLKELADAINDDASFATTVTNHIATAKTDAEAYTDSSIATEVTNRNSAILTAKNAAISTSESYTDSAISSEVSNRNSEIATSLSTAESYADAKKAEAISTSETYADTVVATEASNRATAVSAAITTSENYTDAAISTEVTNRDSAILTATTGIVKTTDIGSVTSAMILDGTIVNADISSSAAIADTKLATIITSGKVANSATTATDANTANAIVSRDASGNFTANLITVNTTPTSAGHAASKAYVDNISAGMNWHAAVVAATSGVLPSSTYADGTTDANGGLGIGATLTATANAALAIDTINVNNGNRVLIKNQANAKQNGIYVVTDKGSSSTKWVLTRATDSDNHTRDEVSAGDAVYVLYGPNNLNQSFVATMTGSGTNGLVLIGTDNITWTQFSGASSFVAGNGLLRTGNTVDVVSSTLNVTADSVDLATVSQSNTTGGNLANGIVSAITVDSYGRVTGYQTGAQNVASTSNKGIASFDPASFTVTSGNVVIKSGGVLNTQLANSSVTVGTTAIALGSSSTILAGLTSVTSTGFTGALTGNSDTATKLSTPRNINGVAFDGSAGITVTAAAGTLTGSTLNSNIVTSSLTTVGTLNSLTTSGDVTVGGNLIVNGITTTLNSTTLTVTDKNIEISKVASPTDTTADGAGITVKGTTDKTFNYINATPAFTSSENLDLAIGKTYKINGDTVLSNNTLGSNITSSSLTSLGTLTNLTVTNTILGSVTGNAGTATKLLSSVNINGVAFDGSAGITVTAAAGTLTGSTLNSQITSSSLTSVGTITSGVWNGTTIDVSHGGTGLTTTTKGGIFVGTSTSALTNLPVGSDGYLLTADSSETSGVKWAAAPVSLPSQTGNNGYWLTTNGTTASWSALPTLVLAPYTISTNDANTVDTTSLSSFTTIEYILSIKQGSHVRSSKILVQTDGTNVDYTEYGIIETGGTILGVNISAIAISTNMVLQVIIADASSTNGIIKLVKNLL